VLSCPQAGINPVDTRNDVDGREMFHPLTLKHAFLGENEGEVGWYRSMSRTSRRGLECCSAESISFHYISSPEAFYCLDDLIYKHLEHEAALNISL